MASFDSSEKDDAPLLRGARIVVVEPLQVVRAALKSCLEVRHLARVVGQFAVLGEMLPLLTELQCDVILTEVEPVVAVALRAVRQAKALAPKVGLLVLTSNDDPRTVLSLLEAGADGYFVKTGTGVELVQAIHDLRHGRGYIHPKVAEHVLTALRSPHPHKERFSLSAREREILCLLVDGRDIRQVSVALNLSPNTIKTHLRTLYKKLAVSGRAQAVLVALRERLVQQVPVAMDFTPGG